jgi:hypothetical protein
MYTKEEEEFLVEKYTNAIDKQTVLDDLASTLNKPRRSIIGKLSRLGVYEKKIYLTKRGEEPVTKLELVAEIAEKTGIPLEKLAGLEKAPKEVLKCLKSYV